MQKASKKSPLSFNYLTTQISNGTGDPGLESSGGNESMIEGREDPENEN